MNKFIAKNFLKAKKRAKEDKMISKKIKVVKIPKYYKVNCQRKICSTECLGTQDRILVMKIMDGKKTFFDAVVADCATDKEADKFIKKRLKKDQRGYMKDKR